jgi:hypothetical protein
VRYLLMVPRREFTLLAEPDSQKALLDAYLRQLPHEETVIEFTGNTMNDLSIAVIAGFNWLNHCAGLAGADRKTFSGTLNHFRKIAMAAQKWWEMDGARERHAQMLRAQGVKRWRGFSVRRVVTCLSPSLRGAKRRSNPSIPEWCDGLLRSARNDGEGALLHPFCA